MPATIYIFRRPWLWGRLAMLLLRPIVKASLGTALLAVAWLRTWRTVVLRRLAWITRVRWPVGSVVLLLRRLVLIICSLPVTGVARLPGGVAAITWRAWRTVVAHRLAWIAGVSRAVGSVVLLLRRLVLIVHSRPISGVAWLAGWRSVVWLRVAGWLARIVYRSRPIAACVLWLANPIASVRGLPVSVALSILRCARRWRSHLDGWAGGCGCLRLYLANLCRCQRSSAVSLNSLLLLCERWRRWWWRRFGNNRAGLHGGWRFYRRLRRRAQNCLFRRCYCRCRGAYRGRGHFSWIDRNGILGN